MITYILFSRQYPHGQRFDDLQDALLAFHLRFDDPMLVKDDDDTACPQQWIYQAAVGGWRWQKL